MRVRGAARRPVCEEELKQRRVRYLLCKLDANERPIRSCFVSAVVWLRRWGYAQKGPPACCRGGKKNAERVGGNASQLAAVYSNTTRPS